MKQLLLLIFLIAFASPVSMTATTAKHATAYQSFVDDFDEDFTLLTNPVKDGVLKLKVNATDVKNVSITIIDSLGEQVFNEKSNTNKQIINFDVSKLAAGIYFLRIQGDDNGIVKKLIIQ